MRQREYSFFRIFDDIKPLCLVSAPEYISAREVLGNFDMYLYETTSLVYAHSQNYKSHVPAPLAHNRSHLTKMAAVRSYQIWISICSKIYPQKTNSAINFMFMPSVRILWSIMKEVDDCTPLPFHNIFFWTGTDLLCAGNSSTHISEHFTTFIKDRRFEISSVRKTESNDRTERQWGFLLKDLARLLSISQANRLIY